MELLYLSKVAEAESSVFLWPSLSYSASYEEAVFLSPTMWIISLTGNTQKWYVYCWFLGCPITLKFWLIYTNFRQKLTGLGPRIVSKLSHTNNQIKNYPIWGCLVLVLLIALTINYSGLGAFAPSLGGGPIGGELTEVVSTPSVAQDSGLLGNQTLAASIDPTTNVDMESGNFIDSSLQTTGDDALLPSGNPETQQAPQNLPAPASPKAPSYSYGPDLGGYFIFPTTGFDRGRLHYYNAVDISAGSSCFDQDIPVLAAASGVITAASWANGLSRYENGGYGNNVMILHPNGVLTRYAHLKQILVKDGQYVNQGETIAYMGGYPGVYGSGNSTGCHLHFEVRGAQNPFAR